MNFIEEKILAKGNLDKLKFRFPPENSGYLTLGHAKAIHLNFGLAEKYSAPCNLRFDDTNPSNESEEFTNSIIEDIKWLGYTPSEILFTSDYFDKLYDYAVVLIKKGLAYVDDSTSDEIAVLKGTTTIAGKDSPYKSRTIEENLDLFNRMKLGEFKEGSKILRANIDMASPNMILRDPILYRIIDTPHHRTGDKWKIYPMYDFAHPLSDYIESISDSLCTLEFEVHRPLYMWILENCDLDGRLPEETEFARLNIDYSVMSKRKFKTLVENNIVDGWDDPRLLTISGLRRRGFTPESIKNFCEVIGVTKRESVVSYLLLEECLRNDLNKRSNRLMCVTDPIKLTIKNWDKGTEFVEIENNPEDDSAGSRMVEFSGNLLIDSEDFMINPDKKYFRLKPDGEVRLKGGYVIKATGYKTNNSGKVTEVECTYDPMTKSGMMLDRKIKGTIHWLSESSAVPMSINEYDRLFNESDPEKDGDFMKYINNNSLVKNDMAFVESEILKCNSDKPVQMVRKGYYKLDNKNGLCLNKTVSLKESYK